MNCLALGRVILSLVSLSKKKTKDPNGCGGGMPTHKQKIAEPLMVKKNRKK